jgi:hemerythrin-like domain-containing protein
MSQTKLYFTHEHDDILALISVFSRMLDAVSTGNISDFEDCVSFLEFLEEYVEHYHMGKEESILFPAMASSAELECGVLINELVAEHIQSRGLLGNMIEVMDKAVDAAKFSRTGHQYIELIRNHIQKENTYLFPLADNWLSQGKNSEEFQKYDKSVIIQGNYEDFRIIIQKFTCMYQ